MLGTIGLIAITIAGSIGTGMVIDGYVINHPVQLLGHCPSPYVLTGNGCFQNLITTGADGKQTTTQVPAGTVTWPNGTSYGG